MLCLSGDHQQFGNHPLTKGVFDIDSIQLISMVRGMRDDKKFLNGDEIDVAPQIFIGAAANPFAEPFEFRVHRLAKKINAGADFIQTQCIYDMKRFREWIKQANDMGLTEKVKILAGITPLKSGGMADIWRRMSRDHHPDEIIDRVVKAKKPADERFSSAWNRFKSCGKSKAFVAFILWRLNGNIGFQKLLSGPNWFLDLGFRTEIAPSSVGSNREPLSTKGRGEKRKHHG
jgi:methylenetetrahydrofolate reductase (NADPH)